MLLRALNQRLLGHAAKKATAEDKQALVSKVDAFIFDCDGGHETDTALNQTPCARASRQSLAGVIWRGDSVIDGVPETLDLLRSLVSVA